MDTQTQNKQHQQQQDNKQKIICGSCGRQNRLIAKFCKECGKPVQAVSGSDSHSNTEINLTGIVGLEHVKKNITQIVNRVKIHNERKSKGMPVNPLYLHSVFMGRTGTGKTLVARYFAQEFKKIGALSNGTLLEIDYEMMNREGQNLQGAVKKWIDKARGGILFFDEIHKITPAISTIIRTLATAGDDIIVIMAGIKEPLDEYFDKNREEKQRIGVFFDFTDYSAEEISQITLLKLGVYSYKVDEEAAERLRDYVRTVVYSGESEFKNGWLVERKIIPEIMNLQSNRLAEAGQLSNDDLALIISPDIPDEGVKRKTPDEIISSMENLVGLDEVKKEIKKLAQAINIQQEQLKAGMKGAKIGVHIVFTGNPGTGKTTVARILGELFRSIGLLPGGHLIETDRSKLVAQYVGQTAPNVNKYCDDAMGGVLLVDEAYTLAGEDGAKDTFGQEAIEALMKRMEDDRGKFVVIAAGYEEEMQRFISANPGLKSRFTHFFHLEDYKPEELYRIFMIMAEGSGYNVSEEASEKLKNVLKEIFEKRDKRFANGRTVRNLFEATTQDLAARLSNLTAEERVPEALNLITPDDIRYELQKTASMEEIMASLDKLVGMENIKKEVRDLISFVNIQRKREEIEGKKTSIAPHMVFTGNPGTGKTTVARIIAGLFKSIGILPSDHIIEVDKAGLVGQYVGSTPKKVKSVIDRAIGGVLFIDEAYTLTPEGQTDSFSQEAIDTLMKSMEDDKGKYIVMAAGYQKEMERFLKSNPGLPSRFTKKFHFEDYKPDELEKIFHLTAGGKGYKLSDNAAESLKQHCKYMYENRGENFGNGRDIRNLFEQILQNQSMRLSRLIAEQTEIDNSLYSIIDAEDFPVLKKDEGSLEKALEQLNSLIGLSAVKKEVSQLINYLKAEKLRNKGELSAANMTLHYIFTGNPGTGKTTVGRIISNIFKEMGLLSKGHLVEKDRGGLVGQYVGETAQKTTTAINESMGGVLFIDEAYALVPAQGGNDFGKEAVDTLLKRMEDDRGRFIVIAAGYINDMNRFLESNPGLTSRFPRKIDFEDYKPDELYAIFASMVKSRKMSMADNFSEKLKQRLNDIYNNRDKNFANGRTVRNLFESTLQQQSSRIAGIMNIEQDDPALNTFEAEDLI